MMLRPESNNYIVIVRDRRGRLGALGFDNEEDAEASFAKLSHPDHSQFVIIATITDKWISAPRKKTKK